MAWKLHSKAEQTEQEFWEKFVMGFQQNVENNQHLKVEGFY